MGQLKVKEPATESRHCMSNTKPLSFCMYTKLFALRRSWLWRMSNHRKLLSNRLNVYPINGRLISGLSSAGQGAPEQKPPVEP